MDARARQDRVAQQVESVPPQALVEWIDGEDLHLEPRFDQGSHVALEEGAHAGGILARKYGQPHAVPRLRTHGEYNGRSSFEHTACAGSRALSALDVWY